jgi:hypothetical protein
LGLVDDIEREDDQRGLVDVDELLAAMELDLLGIRPVAGPPCCGQTMIDLGGGSWQCDVCGATVTPFRAHVDDLLLVHGLLDFGGATAEDKPPLPQRDPVRPPRHAPRPPQQQPGVPHPQNGGGWQCRFCGERDDNGTFCGSCGKSR